VIERNFDAPVELVWRMWTDAQHFKAWYGPTGATSPVAKMDVREGSPGATGWTMAFDKLAGHVEMQRPR
jgi:uncharacterized protein YndB with AHSA1/START domain